MVDVNIRRLDLPEERRLPLYDQLRDSMSRVPGVHTIAATSIALMNNGGWTSGILVDGYTLASERDLPPV